MSRKGRRVCFSPDGSEKPVIFLKHGGGGNRGNRKRVVVAGIWSFKVSKETSSGFSAMRFLHRLKTKVVRAICVVSKRSTTQPRPSTTKKSTSCNLARSRSVSEAIDSHRAQALEDCIEFLNSSSSLQRSNSVSSSCC